MVLKLISAKKRRIFPSAKALFPLAQHVVNAASQSILVNEPMLKIRRRVPLAPAAALGGARTARGAASEESTWEGGREAEFRSSNGRSSWSPTPVEGCMGSRTY